MCIHFKHASESQECDYECHLDKNISLYQQNFIVQNHVIFLSYYCLPLLIRTLKEN